MSHQGIRKRLNSSAMDRVLSHRALRLPRHPLRGDAREHRGALARRDHTPGLRPLGPAGIPRPGRCHSVRHLGSRGRGPDRLEGPRADAGAAREGSFRAPTVNKTSPMTAARVTTISLCAHVLSNPNRYVKPTAAIPLKIRTAQRTAGTPSSEATRRVLLASASLWTWSRPSA